MQRRIDRVSQISWLAFAVLSLGLALAGLRYRFAELQTVCDKTQCMEWQVTADQIATLARRGPRVDAALLKDYAFATIAYDSILSIFICALGGILIWQKPVNRTANLAAFVFVGLAMMLTGAPDSLARANSAYRLPVQLLRFLTAAGLLVVFSIVPNGHFRWRWSRGLTACFTVACFYFVVVQGMTLDLPIGAANAWLGALAAASTLIIFATLLLRFRAAESAIERQQLQWIIAGTGIAVIWIGLKQALYLVAPFALHAGPANFAGVINTMVVMSFAGCIAVAILQFRLFDIEIAINRGLVYGALTLFIVGAYALIVGGLSVAFARLAPVDDAVTQFLMPVIATGLIALVFQPLRERLQRAVNRLMYGERDEPYAALARLGQRLEAAFEPTAILPNIVETVAKTLKLPYVAIATMESGVLSVKSEWRTPDATSSALSAQLFVVPLIYQNESLGELRASPRQDETTLSEADRRLLTDLAQQASVAVHGLLLMNDLHRLTEDLQNSRERLVLAREEERRRLRRDLHDDLSPTLAGLAITANTVADIIPSDPHKAVALAKELGYSIRAAVGGIRRLVYDLRPPTLDELGLVPAIRERAAQFTYTGNGLRVMVDADDLPPLPAAIEVAAYRITQEALMNVARHARAHNCHIRLAVIDEHLILDIADDGVGLDSERIAGVGLGSMHERAMELGGQCLVESHPNGGTRVRASLPVYTQNAH